MKVSWSITLAAGLVAGLMLGSYLSHPDRAPVLRGYKALLPAVLQSPSAEDDRQPGASLVIEEPEAPAALHLLPDSPDWSNPTQPAPTMNLNWNGMTRAGTASGKPIRTFSVTSKKKSA